MPTLGNAISEVYRIAKTQGNSFIEKTQRKKEWRNHLNTCFPSRSIMSYFYVLIPVDYNYHTTLYFVTAFKNKLKLGKSI